MRLLLKGKPRKYIFGLPLMEVKRRLEQRVKDNPSYQNYELQMTGQHEYKFRLQPAALKPFGNNGPEKIIHLEPFVSGTKLFIRDSRPMLVPVMGGILLVISIFAGIFQEKYWLPVPVLLGVVLLLWYESGLQKGVADKLTHLLNEIQD